MRRRLRTIAITSALASASLIGATTAVAPAQVAATSTKLPGLMGAMVVDPATSHVFVSLHDTGNVAVLNFDGTIVKTITGESGARGLVLVGTHVYVVASTANRIDEISTATLARTRTVASGIAGMNDIVSAAGALWVHPESAGTARFVKVAFANGAQTPYADAFGTGYSGLVSDPTDANAVVNFDPGISAVTLRRFDMSTDPPTMPASRNLSSPDVISNVSDVVVTPDGQRAIPAGGAPYKFDQFSMTDFTQVGGAYPANPYPTAVAVTSAAGGLFAGGMNGIYNPDVVVYHLGDASATVATHDFNSTSQTVEGGGLAFSPNGQRLFAITGDNGFQSPQDTFHVLTLSGVNPPSTSTVTVSPTKLAFGNQRVGTFGASKTVTITNTGTNPVSLTSLALVGTNSLDFFGVTDCFPRGAPRSLAPGAYCRAAVYFGALKAGARSASLHVVDNTAKSPHAIPLSGNGTEGYFLAGAHGQVGNFGDAVFHGDATSFNLSAPMISLATTPNGAGYWLLASDGGIFSYGNAKFYGSTGGMRLNRPIVALFPTPNGKGYWLVGSDGGIFTFGAAQFYGSTGAIHLNQPIDGMASTLDGKGYWLVASDGGIFAFGDAKFYGSAGGTHLTAPVVQMTPTRTGHGYWLLTGDGQLYAYGDARVFGTASGQPIVGMARTPDDGGYWEVSRTGDIFAFGNARSLGDLHGLGINDVVGIAATAPPLPPDITPQSAAAGMRAAFVNAANGSGFDVDPTVGRPIERG